MDPVTQRIHTRVFMMMVEAEKSAMALERSWELLAECIRSGQMADEHVGDILNKDPDFAAWYRTRYGKGKDDGRS